MESDSFGVLPGRMADPHHIPVLDGFDRLTVRLYRLGLWIAAVALVVAACVRLAEVSVPFETLIFVQAGVALACTDRLLRLVRISEPAERAASGDAPMGPTRPRDE